ncbi:Plasmodium vivax Vir protein, putative [Plasmodium vivax]|uniref:Vir protein, putative n=1 Tax=Plasmodium vivax TaxID=5855 RepID=A0A1G4EC34_PLAVI|nr:Plasmodium vivax Vir protein, putative [Plasmodium vivax]
MSEGKYFKNIKLFFDYSKDYDIYKDQLDPKKTPLCIIEYKKYLQTYVDTYNEFEGECKNGRTPSGYCKAFNEYFDSKDRAKLSNWTCNLQNKEPEKEREEEQVAGEPLLQRAQGMEVNPAKDVKQFSSGSGEEEKPHGFSDNDLRGGTPELDRVSGPADTYSISRTTKTIATTASVAGILVPPFLVYNFTPVRSWINKLLGRNQMYRNPLTEKELTENSYQPHHFDSERNRYNISYRPE